MNLPNVKIIIANHNYGKYIEKAIASAVKQDYKNIDILIVDDCSTDDSWAKISYAVAHYGIGEKTSGDNLDYSYIETSYKNFNKITAYRLKKQCGPSFARNIAIHNSIQQSQSHFYAILDADDEYYPDKVSQLINTALTSGSIGVVYGDYDILNVEDGTLIREYKEPFSVKRLHQECIVHSGALISAQALLHTVENTGYYDNRLRCAEDYDLWLRISNQFVICHVPKSLSLVRVHKQNSTESVSKEIWQNCWNLVSEKTRNRHVNANK